MSIDERFSNFALESSNGGLEMMHRALLDAFNTDEAIAQGLPKRYGVREHIDWRKWSDALEAQLKERNLPFVPIPW